MTPGPGCDGPPTLRDRGSQAFREGRYQGAELAGRFPFGVTSLGSGIDLALHADAIVAFGEALQQNPEDPTLLSNRCAALLAYGKTLAALQDAQACVKVCTWFVMMLFSSKPKQSSCLGSLAYCLPAGSTLMAKSLVQVVSLPHLHGGMAACRGSSCSGASSAAQQQGQHTGCLSNPLAQLTSVLG
jgi:hypothetical protein